MAPYNADLHTLLFDLPPLADWVSLPLGIALFVIAVLWSGRVRQPHLANSLCLGILLPVINLTLILVGLHSLGSELNLAWMDLVQQWPI
ncbi:hypothetical protein [Alcanivorax hongdengensis]|nr:hypothetical protein [Alcanivorax hongdengensis]